MTFQRARSEEQREIRRRTILEAAAGMLDEMPVAEVTLNELSRRVGLAKSNVLRYFDSREAVLLELLDDFVQAWLADLAQQLAVRIDPEEAAGARARRVADILSSSLAQRVVLCDLFGAQGGVLERNVSVEVAVRHKRSSLESLTRMSDLVRRALPEIGEDARDLCLIVLVSAGALSSYVPAPPSVVAAYAQEPELGILDIDLEGALRIAVTSALLGVLPRP